MKKSKARHIDIVAHSFGGVVAVELVSITGMGIECYFGSLVLSEIHQ